MKIKIRNPHSCSEISSSISLHLSIKISMSTSIHSSFITPARSTDNNIFLCPNLSLHV